MDFLSELNFYTKLTNTEVFDKTKVAENGVLGLKGRASRKEFWYNFLCFWMINIGLTLITQIPIIGAMLSPIIMIVSTYMSLILIRLEVRRFHDFNATGWWVLFIKIIALVLAGIVAWRFSEFAMNWLVDTEFFTDMSDHMTYLMFDIMFKFLSFICAYSLNQPVLFLFMCIPSTDGENKYGEPRNYTKEMPTK